jgi:hypothetical protein
MVVKILINLFKTFLNMLNSCTNKFTKEAKMSIRSITLPSVLDHLRMSKIATHLDATSLFFGIHHNSKEESISLQ